ncbi:MAG TPA: amino acid adenylation domain-containing protein [Thermoanaerobaculia bacterium]|nr:amino acid adenylation domain-containing protein [Thermoanaerobaculia bacterium]
MDQAFIEGFRLSPQQRRLWTLPQAPSGRPAQAAFHLAGDLDRGALRRALESVVARHEILRTTYRCLSGMDLPIQMVGEARLTFRELEEGGGGEEAVHRLLSEEGALPCEEEGGTLVRCSLLPVGAREHLLTVTLPPAAADDRSLCNLLGEIAEKYGAALSGAPPDDDEEDGAVQYVDFSEWQNGLLEEEGAEERRELWRRRRRAPEPDRRARRSASDGEAGSGPLAVRRWLDPALTREIGALAESQGVSVSTVLLAAWKLLLARLLDAPDLVVGCLADGRRFEQLAQALGLFARYLPVSVPVQPDFAVTELLSSIEAAAEEGSQHQEYFLWEDFLDEDRGSFPALFDYAETPAAVERGGVTFALAERRVRFEPSDLRLSARRDDRGLRLELLSGPGLLTAAEAERWLARFEAALRSMVRQPGQPVAELDLLGDEERLLLTGWSRTGTGELSPWPAHRLFEQQAARTPEALALLADGCSLTFAELDRRASQVGRFLARRGLEPGSLLGIALERSADQIVALLAAWKAGAAFVPLDPAQPRQRLERMVEDLAASAAGGLVVLTHSALCGHVAPAGVAVVEIDTEAVAIDRESAVSLAVSDPDLPAYWIFTSGSTGRPKGTVIRHRSVVNLAAALDRAIYSHHGDALPLRVSVNAPLAFDASIKQIVQLLSGHALCLIPEEVRRDGEALLAFLRRQQVDVLDCTPSQLGLLLDAGLLVGSGGPRLVLVGGEAIGRELWETLAGQEKVAFYDVYGPTECTVDTTAERIAPGTAPNIGRPLHNVQVHLLDAALQRTPVGVAGEICIGGAGLALGYAGRPDQTAAKFVPDPFAESPGERLYRSGDLARHRDDGRIEYLGRRDHQVKVRGYRIELGEIEAALADHPGVRAAVVLAREDSAGNPRLAAYVVPRSATAAHLQARGHHALPNGMAVFALDRTETDYIFQEIFEDRLYLRHGIELCEDATVFDVGANIGLFSLFVRQEAPRARIFAFEPIPPVFDALRANVDLYRSDVRLFPFGLSDREETVEFTYYPHFSSRSGLAAYADRDNELEVTRRHLQNTWNEAASDGFGGEMEDVLDGKFVEEIVAARVRRLADVLREERVERVDLLKIDVQRAELDVLRGIDDEAWRRIEQVVMEVHDEPGGATEGRVAEITALLERHGFEVASEQDEALRGTDRHSLFASRRGLSPRTAEVRGSAAQALPKVAPPGELTPAQLRGFLDERLPEPMIPADIVILEELPYNRNGKVDRQALPAPEEVQGAQERPRLAPRTPVEEILAALFGEVLGCGAIGVDESFFELGGHSLLATQLVSRVRETFRVDLPLRMLFEAPSVEELASVVDRAMQAGRGLTVPVIERVLDVGDAPLSFAQESFWFLHQLDPESASYNSGWALHVQGPLEAGAMEAALSEMVRRHAVLRTTFPAVAGQPVQRVMPPAPVPLERGDLRPLPEAERTEEARRRVREELRRPFNLAKGPLVRGVLLRTGEHEHLLILAIHHIVCDGWSLTVMQRELAALYAAFLEGQPSPLPELTLQYTDFAHWQRRWMQGRVLEEHLSYWKARLAGAPAEIELPQEADPVWSESRRTFVLPAELGAGLHDLARRHSATLYMTLLAAFGVLLARSSDQEDLVVGTAVAGRDRTEIEGLIGLFINMLPIRLDLRGALRFADLLAQVREVTLEAYMHQGLPFEKLVGEIPQVRSSGRNPLFQVAFGLQNLPWQPLEFSGLTLTPWEVGHDEVRLDLTLWMSESPEGLRASWTYNPLRFRPETIERWQARFARLLGAILSNPEGSILDLEMLGEEERQELESRKKQRESTNLARLRGVQRRSLSA